MIKWRNKIPQETRNNGFCMKCKKHRKNCECCPLKSRIILRSCPNILANLTVLGTVAVEEGKDEGAKQAKAPDCQKSGKVGAGCVEENTHQTRPGNPSDAKHKIKESVCSGVVGPNLSFVL